MVARPRLRGLGAAVSGPRLCAGPGPVPRLSRLCFVGPARGWLRASLVSLWGRGRPLSVPGALGPVPRSGFVPAPSLSCAGPSALPRCCVPRPGFPLTSLPSLSAPPGLRGKREACGLGLRPVPSELPSRVFPWPVRQPCRASSAARVRVCAPGAHLVQGVGLTFGTFCGTLSVRSLSCSFGGLFECVSPWDGKNPLGRKTGRVFYAHGLRSCSRILVGLISVR